jgi:hypothetical protein
MERKQFAEMTFLMTYLVSLESCCHHSLFFLYPPPFLGVLLQLRITIFFKHLADSAIVARAAAGENSPDPARNPPLLEVKFQSRFVADCANVP